MINNAKRIVQGDLQNNEEEEEITLRPKFLDEYIGQEKHKRNLNVFIEAAKQRNEALEHILIYGPPGLGKTTLAHIISREMRVNIKATSGPAIERPGDLASILTNLEENDVLFIDEIHRLKPQIEEVLYSAMEDFELDIMLGKGPSAKSIKLNIAPFTLIGATTKVGKISSPLRDRFGSVIKLEFYSDEEIAKIIFRASSILNISVEEEALGLLAVRSRRTPRIANRLLRRVRDFAQVGKSSSVTVDITNNALQSLEIDNLGLDNADRELLDTMISKFSGNAVGLSTLAAALSEETETIEDVYEPFLLQLGLLERTPKGRKATKRAYEHMGYEIEKGKLF